MKGIKTFATLPFLCYNYEDCDKAETETSEVLTFMAIIIMADKQCGDEFPVMKCVGSSVVSVSYPRCPDRF